MREEDTAPRVGDIYRWAGKRWEVVAVDATSRTASVANVDRRYNTARMPWPQFRDAEGEA